MGDYNREIEYWSTPRRKAVIYLSGPMTGLPDYNYPAFEVAAKRLREMGNIVKSPAELEQEETHEDYMRKCVQELALCDVIALLPGWEDSKGARGEIFIADLLGMQIVDAETLKPIELDVVVDVKERKVVRGESKAKSDMG